MARPAAMTRRLLIEADGGARGNPGAAGYGAVVHDAVTGAVLAEVSEAIGRATNNVAEYSALLAALRAAARLAPGADAEIRMDSRLVVEQMSGRWKIKNPELRALAAQAAQAAGALGRVTYTWVPRERNAHADRLANQAMDAAARRERASEAGERLS
jgi:probable phosphoglycerate mutase